VDKKTSDAIDRLVADWPPLTEEKKAELAVLLNPPGYVPPLNGYGTAPVDCPACGERFTGRWEFGAWLKTRPYPETEQACPGCGHVTLAAWPVGVLVDQVDFMGLPGLGHVQHQPQADAGRARRGYRGDEHRVEPGSDHVQHAALSTDVVGGDHEIKLGHRLGSL
jgi:hypothetical protein